MLRQGKLIFTIATVSIVTFAHSHANAFQVFSNSRPGASANRSNPRTATGTITSGNRHGLAGGLSNHQWSYNSPGGQFRSNSSRRSTSSYGSPRQSPVFHNYNPGTLNRSGTTTYHSGGLRIQRRSGVATFSGPGYYDPYVPGYNGVAVGGVIVNGGRARIGGRYDSHHHGSGPIYIVDPFYSPYATGYPSVPGGQIPFGVYAPPVVVPYVNQGINVNVGPGFAPGNAVPGNAVPGNGVPVNGFAEEAPVPESMSNSDVSAIQAYSNPIPVDEAALNNEFPVTGAPTDTVESSAVKRIRSLRYQTSADTYYRDADFASAEALYRSATKEAPDRIAPWLRLAFTQVSLQKFDDAARSLKAGLNRNDDPSTAWITSDNLAGKGRSDLSLLAEDQLFDWLKQRPNSTDRLLLVAAWSEFRGSSSSARELLQMAKNAGLSDSIASNLKAVVADRPQKEAAPAMPARAIPFEEDHAPNPGAAEAIESFSDADIELLPIERSPIERLPQVDTDDKPEPIVPQSNAPLSVPTGDDT